jgi:hypothetical protein
VKALAIGDTESVLGEIPVSVKRGIGFEKLRLYVSDKRIIVAHESSRGLRALALRPLLGRYSGDLEESSEGRDRRVVKTELQTLSPARILSSHKDNFALSFEEVVSVELKGSEGVGIVILTGNEKFQFSTRTEREEVAALLAPGLGAKLTK